jgi:hypothetical protein
MISPMDIFDENEISMLKKDCTSMFIVALFTIAKK